MSPEEGPRCSTHDGKKLLPERAAPPEERSGEGRFGMPRWLVVSDGGSGPRRDGPRPCTGARRDPILLWDDLRDVRRVVYVSLHHGRWERGRER